MKLNETIVYSEMSAEDKKKQMLEKELETLKSFYERNAITKVDYDKGLIALQREIEKLESK